jgi:hypothetical protein
VPGYRPARSPSLRVSRRTHLADPPLHDDDVAIAPGGLQVRRRPMRAPSRSSETSAALVRVRASGGTCATSSRARRPTSIPKSAGVTKPFSCCGCTTTGTSAWSCPSTTARLSRLLAHVAAGTADGLPEPTYSLTGRLPQLLAEAADPLTDPAERLSGAAGKLADCTAGAERLSCGIAQAPERLARRATGLNGLLCRLADVAKRLGDGAAGSERLLTEVTDAPDSVVDSVDEALEDFGVPVESRECTVEDVVEVLEAHLQLRLCFDAFDVDLDLA